MDYLSDHLFLANLCTGACIMFLSLSLSRIPVFWFVNFSVIFVQNIQQFEGIWREGSLTCFKSPKTPGSYQQTQGSSFDLSFIWHTTLGKFLDPYFWSASINTTQHTLAQGRRREQRWFEGPQTQLEALGGEQRWLEGIPSPTKGVFFWILHPLICFRPEFLFGTWRYASLFDRQLE